MANLETKIQEIPEVKFQLPHGDIIQSPDFRKQIQTDQDDADNILDTLNEGEPKTLIEAGLGDILTKSSTNDLILSTKFNETEITYMRGLYNFGYRIEGSKIPHVKCICSRIDLIFNNSKTSTATLNYGGVQTELNQILKLESDKILSCLDNNDKNLGREIFDTGGKYNKEFHFIVQTYLDDVIFDIDRTNKIKNLIVQYINKELPGTIKQEYFNSPSGIKLNPGHIDGKEAFYIESQYTTNNKEIIIFRND